MQIKDKKAIVTGGASSLGLAFSRELLRNGAAVSTRTYTISFYSFHLTVIIMKIVFSTARRNARHPSVRRPIGRRPIER